MWGAWICVAFALSTMLDSSALVDEGSGITMLFSDSLAGWFCNLEVIGWLGGVSGPGDAGSNFSCWSWSPTVNAWDGRFEGWGGVETLYKYLIRQSSQPASAVQTHSTKYLVSLMWLACGDLEKNCEITNMLDSSWWRRNVAWQLFSFPFLFTPQVWKQGRRFKAGSGTR